MLPNGHLQVVVANFEERQCPAGHDGQERSRDNAHHCTRNAICKLLAQVFFIYVKFKFFIVSSCFKYFNRS